MNRSTSLDLRDRTVLVTGAGSGIGAACARLVHARGARLVLVDVSAGGITELARALGEDRALACVASVTDRAALDGVVEQALRRFGRLDVVFANAGIACDPPTTVRCMDEATFERIVEIDLLGVWRTVRACLPQVVEHRGHVLVTASIYAYVNGIANAPYAMSKAGVEMFGRALRAELAGTGATAGVLYPGWVDTPIARSAMGGHDTTAELVRLAFPRFLRRPVTPDAVARATVRGLERRSARIVVPARWAPVSLLRGVFGVMSDAALDRHRPIQRLIRRLEVEGASRRGR